jgi:dipeptidase E
MKLLLSSNSTLAGAPYLAFCKAEINSFLAENKAVNIVFIPFAASTFSYDDYVQNVSSGLDNDSIVITGIHQYSDKQKAIKEADCIVVGGGNSFKLLNEVYENDLLNSIQEVVKKGTPYIGWSAGSNLACPTIKTTNDMPIVEPQSFTALNLVPFQINPHYTEERLPNHGGETRKDRINEFIALNKNIYVAGVPEGNILKIENNQCRLIGSDSIKIFKQGQEIQTLTSKDNLDFLLKE